MNNNLYSYQNLKAYTLVPDSNSSYMSNLHYSSPGDPISGPTIGLMMALSALQWQGPTMGPVYSQAASQAGKAAYIQSGGQEMQNRVTSKVENTAKDAVHSIGITDNELGVVLGAAKVYKDRAFSVKGPRIGPIRTTLTATQNSGTVGLGWNW